MKTVVLRIEDSAFDNFKAFVHLCPSIEIVEEYSELEVRNHVDICIEKAIFELQKNRVFRKPSDYTYVMQVINNKKVKDAPFFLTPDVFRLYLKEIGVQPLPGRSTIYDTIQILKGELISRLREYFRTGFRIMGNIVGQCFGQSEKHPSFALFYFRNLHSENFFKRKILRL